MGTITEGFVSRLFAAAPGNIFFIVHIYDYGTEFRALMAAIAEGLCCRHATGAPGIFPFFTFHNKG